MAGSHATIRGDRLVTQLLSEMVDRTRGVATVWPKVGDVIADHMDRQFESQGSHLLGRPWKPLTPPWLAYKVRKGYDPRILHMTGEMRDSLTSRPMAVEEYRPFSATFGTDDRKAAWHQEGAGNLPERAMMVVTEPFADDVTQVIARYIFEERLS